MENMILLRSDLHRLYDTGLLSIIVKENTIQLRSALSVKSHAKAAIILNQVKNYYWKAHIPWISKRLVIQPCSDHVVIDQIKLP